MPSQFEFTIEQRALQTVARVLKSESNGKQLRKDLVNEIKDAVRPGVSAVQAKLQGMPHRSIASPSPGLGSYVAARVKPQVRLTGRTTGVRIRVAKTPKLRGFTFAARRLNRTSWRHRVYGRNVWVEQLSPIPGFFDRTLEAGKPQYRRAVMEALGKTARRIAREAR